MSIRDTLHEMTETLADLKKQIGRDMPHFDKLAANIKALEQPEEHFSATTGALPEGFPGKAQLAAAGIGTFTQLGNELRERQGVLTHIKDIDLATQAQIQDAVVRKRLRKDGFVE